MAPRPPVVFEAAMKTYPHSMCSSLTALRMWVLLLCYLLAEAKAYPLQAWPVYPAREYPEDDYYYAPKVQYYYDAPAVSVPEVYGQVPYYYYDPYGHFANEAPKKQEERLAALPIGQETWFESDPAPRWRANMDDVNAAFLDNLILTQMAQDAQRRRENSRAVFAPDYEEKDNEDEDVRELKALAGKPFYHVPKTVPRIEDEDYEEDDADVDPDSDDSFINWNSKRSVTTAAPTTEQPRAGQKEVVMPRPAQNTHKHQANHKDKDSPFYRTLEKMLKENHESKGRRIDKRFVSSDSDLVVELRGLKHRIAT